MPGGHFPGGAQQCVLLLDLARRDGLRVLGAGSIAPNVPRDGFYVTPTVLGDVLDTSVTAAVPRWPRPST